MKFHHHSKFDIILFFILAFMLLILIDLYNENIHLDLLRLVSFLNISIVLAFIIYILRQPGKIFQFTDPLQFYGFFFTIYYIIPILISSFNYSLNNQELTYISFLVAIAFFFFYFGIKRSKISKMNINLEQNFDDNSCKAILFVSTLLIPLIIYYFYWRISENIFFTHAFYYEQRTDFSSSIRDVFIQSTILPLIILIGLATKAKDNNIKKRGIKFLWIYSIGIIITLALSSQTRPAITAFILFFVSVNFYRKIRLNFKKIASFTIISLSIIILVQGQRNLIKSELMFSSNQLQTAFDLAIPTTLEGTKNPAIYSDILFSRSEGNIIFLAAIVNKTNEGQSYLNGEGILIGLSGLIPRILYPNKPVVTAPQLVVKQSFGMPLTDAALTPINQLYAEFGIFGVIIGFYLIGLLLGKYTIYILKNNSVGGYIFFAFSFTYIIQMENELIVGLLSTLRNALIIYILYRISKFLLRRKTVL